MILTSITVTSILMIVTSVLINDYSYVGLNDCDVIDYSYVGSNDCYVSPN